VSAANWTARRAESRRR